jgi:hypothetical protein
MIWKKYACNSCGDEWWAVPLVKSRCCKKCKAKEIEVIDYKFAHNIDFSGQ